MDATHVNYSSNNVKRKIRASKDSNLNTILDEIQQEYGLKRIQFNPKGPSPNVFMGKLQKRMKTYYHSLSNNRTSFKK
jgi:hypothetical protein